MSSRTSRASRTQNNDVHDHVLGGRIPDEVKQNLREMFPEEDIEEFVARQESAYNYIKGNKATSSQARNTNRTNSRGGASFDSQLAMDEALARSLAELDDGFDGLGMTVQPHHGSSTDHNRHVSGIRESHPRETHSRVAGQNSREGEINPDTMTYEELQSLGDDVGHQSKGLSGDLISRLPSYKYKCGFFSKKRTDECVICYSKYKNGVYITTLPCAHQYHTQCIKRWMHESKSCPVCKKEVGDD